MLQDCGGVAQVEVEEEEKEVLAEGGATANGPPVRGGFREVEAAS